MAVIIVYRDESSANLRGDIVFAENTTGHGHVTRSLEGVRGFVYLAVPDEFEISRWPLLEAS